MLNRTYLPSDIIAFLALRRSPFVKAVRIAFKIIQSASIFL